MKTDKGEKCEMFMQVTWIDGTFITLHVHTCLVCYFIKYFMADSRKSVLLGSACFSIFEGTL